MILRATNIVQTGKRIMSLGLVLAAGSALGAETAAESKGGSLYREPTEQSSVAPADVFPIYERVLRFYRPPRNQSRWLDLRLLPTAPDDRAIQPLAYPLAAQLVHALGRGFCMLDSAAAGMKPCGRSNSSEGFLGAELRLSEIYASAPDRVRVVVSCRLVWAPHVTTDNGSQAFIVGRTADGWRILDRHGAGP